MKPAAEETIGQRTQRLRLERGLSQRQLAEPGVSYAYISRIEAGTRQPSVKALRKLARKLGVSVEYLETGLDVASREQREIRLGELELELRLAGRNTTDLERDLRAVLEDAEHDGDAQAALRARSLLGLLAFRGGDHAGAAALLERALASEAASPLAQPELYATLARSYFSAGDPRKAIELLERCLDEAETTAESRTTYARYALYLSYALTDVGELGRAREVLRDAVSRAENLVDPYVRVRLYWSQARLAAAESDARTALANLRRAISLLETTEDTRQLGRAHLLFAEILTFDGDAASAEPHLELAENLLGPDPDREDLYWLRAEQARCAAELGRADEALARAREALDLMRTTDPAEQGTAWWAMAQAHALRGDIDAADEAYRQAVQRFTQQQEWREALAASEAWTRALDDHSRADEADAVRARSEELRRELERGAGRLAHGPRQL